jgi:hypothetical protein
VVRAHVGPLDIARAVSSEAEHPADNREVGESRSPQRIALVAQRQSRRLLTGWLQVRILPGALLTLVFDSRR